jgi:diguanylate cyclase (GGDEF)-like protein
MPEQSINSILDYLKNGFYSSNNYETTLKTYLIYTFSTIALLIFLIMGTNCILDENTLLGTILLSGTALFFFNILYLKFTDNYTVSAYIVLYFLFALMLYLMYMGGVCHTGPLWSFVLPPIVLFIHGLKRGLTELSIFFILIFGILFIKDGLLFESLYAYTFKVRVIIVFMVVVFLSSGYQYTREASMKRMRKMQQDLEFFLRIDPLTGLYNRRGYEHNIPNIEEASYGAILMCDIDYFKKINDTCGHDAGDYVLQAVAKMIRENIRMQDFSVRWGGEEFFIFLSEVTLDEAYRVAEKLRKKIENTPIYYHNKSIDVTMSIGISIIEKDILLNEAIKSADEAMYISKMNGRNQTTRP